MFDRLIVKTAIGNMTKDVNRKFTKKENIHISQYISEKLFKLNNEKKPKSSPEFPFICAINTMCLVCAMLGDNKTSVSKGKPIISLCYPKLLLGLSLILMNSYIFYSHFFILA